MERQQIAITAGVGIVVLLLVVWGLWSLGSGAVDNDREVQQLEQRLDQKDRRISQLERENKRLSSRVDELEKTAQQKTERRKLPQRVHFKLGSARLTPTAKKTLEEVATQLKNAPGQMVKLEGHTDTWPISTARYPSNWELSTHRAVNVLHHLVHHHNVDRERITATGNGEYHPMKPNSTPDNRARNRRVEFILVSQD